MEQDHKRAIRLLQGCTFTPASFDKRFVRDMVARAENAPDKPLTEKQAAYLEKLVHKYRRQHKRCTCLECFKAANVKTNFAQLPLLDERG